MKEIRLKKLVINNFMGIKEFTFEPNGENAMVKGDNGAGKTTLFTAFLWVLFNKDSKGQSQWDIKPLDTSGKVKTHGAEHSVELTLSVDRHDIVLGKIYREVWTKKKGSAEAVFSGNTVDYEVNGVPTKKKDFDATINDLVDEEVFRLLTDPKYFNSLHWQKRREIVLDACGDVSDADVIASTKALADLPLVLGSYKLDDFKEIVKAKRKKINEEIQKLPIRIDEVTKGLPDIEGVDIERQTEKIEILKSSARKKNQALDRIESGGEVAEKTKQLRELEAEMQAIKNKHSEEIQKQIDEKRNEARAFNSNATGDIRNLKKDLTYNTAHIEGLQEKIKSLRSDWTVEDAKEFTFEQDDTCPTCNQPLPKEQLEEARQKAEEAFNLAKAEALQKITNEGKKKGAEVKEFEAENKKIVEQIQKLEKQQAQEEKDFSKVTAEIKTLQNKVNDLPPAYFKKQKEKAEMEEVIVGLKVGSLDEKEKIYDQIVALEESIRDAEKVISYVGVYEQGQKRIKEIAEQEKKLAAEYAELERHLFLTEEFTRAKVAMLEEKINSKFGLVRFKMFDVQVNGGISETCDTLVYGVPYSTGLNTGHQVIGGMDIIKTLSGHYGCYPPIFADNSEAVTDLPEMKAQVIRLVKPEIASEADRKKYSKLVVAIQEKIMEEAV